MTPRHRQLKQRLLGKRGHGASKPAPRPLGEESPLEHRRLEHRAELADDDDLERRGGTWRLAEEGPPA